MKPSKRRRKADLPEKVCPVCGLPFLWRRKWQRDWESVVYCSDRCRARARVARRGSQARNPRPMGA